MPSDKVAEFIHLVFVVHWKLTCALLLSVIVFEVIVWLTK